MKKYSKEKIRNFKRRDFRLIVTDERFESGTKTQRGFENRDKWKIALLNMNHFLRRLDTRVTTLLKATERQMCPAMAGRVV